MNAALADPPELDFDPIERANALLSGWATWERQRREGPRGPQAMGIIIGIPGIREGSNDLVLTDDEFVVLERAIFRLVWRYQEIIHLEYRSVWKKRQSFMRQAEKWRRLGLKRQAYNDRLNQALASFYSDVRSHVDRWLRSSI